MKISDAPRKFGLDLIGTVPWGTHFCQFYVTKEDLIDLLTPYFAEGLRNNEFCMWITSPPLEVEEARDSLEKVVPNLNDYFVRGQIEILSYTQWYLEEGEFDANRVLKRWIEKEEDALNRGFDGLRLSGNTFWIDRSLWKEFTAYEAAINNVVTSRRIIALCTYSLERCNVTDMLDVLKNHVGTLIRKEKDWYLVEDVAHRKEAEELYKQVIQTATDGFWITDLEGRFIDVNEAYVNLIGYSRGELLEMSVSDVEAKETLEETNLHLKRLMECGREVFETQHRRKDGRIVNVEVNATLINRGERRFFVFVHDITRRKRNEEEMRNLALFPEQNPCPVMRIARDGTLLYANSSSSCLLMHWGCTTERSVPDRIKYHVALALDSGAVTQIEEDCCGKFYSFSIAPFTEQGYANLYGTDITGRKETEYELHRAKTDWERTFNSVPDLISIVDDKYRIVRANQALANRLGVTPEQCLGLSCYACVHGSSVPPAFCPNAKTLIDGKEHAAEIHEDRLGGDFLVSTTPLLDEQGRMMGSVHVARDITTSKRIENELRETRDYLESLLNYANAPIIVWDNDFRITKFNRAFERLTGLNSNDAIGKSLEILFPTDRKEECMAHIKRTLEGEYWEIVEIPILHVDGSVRTLMWNSANIFDLSGKEIVATIAQGQDITERKRAEESLRESQRDLNRAQAVAQTGSWRLDAKSNRLAWSDETYRIFGIDKGATLTYDFFLNTVHPDDREFVAEKWQAALRGENYEIEHRINVKGEIRWVREKAEIELDKDGAIIGGFGTVQDITERREMQDKLAEYSRHLERLVEDKTKQLRDAERLSTIGETAGMVGHDIRNPLQTITGELYLVKDDLASVPDGEAKDNLQVSIKSIEAQVDYINKIVTDLQDYAKPLAPCVEEIHLESTIQSLLASIQILENVQVTYYVEKNFPNLAADTSYLRRILNNLITNAVQAMPNGGNLSIRAYSKDGIAFVSVEDTGEGLSEEARKNIFKPLFTTKAKGQGFGLAVVKKLTDALEGRVTFESALGKGTRFTVELPLYSLRTPAKAENP
jgi:PAS domain S-box-containing protein